MYSTWKVHCIYFIVEMQHQKADKKSVSCE